MPYYVYILQSEKDDAYYIGYTQCLEQRLHDHNHGRSRYTRSKLPWKIVYSEIFDSKTEALLRERFLKQQRNTAFYKRLIQGKQ